MWTKHSFIKLGIKEQKTAKVISATETKGGSRESGKGEMIEEARKKKKNITIGMTCIYAWCLIGNIKGKDLGIYENFFSVFSNVKNKTEKKSPQQDVRMYKQWNDRS